MMNIETALLFLPGLVIGLTIHEAAHAISAKWLGDRTAERMGRVSLNPLRHLSPLGTLAIFLVHFGWGKPVQINLYNFKKPRLYYLLSSLAGPVSNLLVAGISLGLIYSPLPGIVKTFLVGVFFINSILAVVNLIPIPPLDGSKIWPCIIPGLPLTVPPFAMKVSMIVLLVALWTGAIDRIIVPTIGLLSNLLPQGV